MKVKWLGHSCFLVTSNHGLRIITDPYTSGSRGVGYAPINEAADIVTVSHDHFDHNDVASVPGKPQVIKGRGVKDVKGIQFRSVTTYHDESQGKQRGNNIIFWFSIDGLNLCHLGDLGHRLSQKEIAEIGKVDILFIPVGGFYTIDAKVASQECNDLKPKVIFPMHYRTPKLDFPIAGVEDFLAGKRNINRLESSEIEFKSDELPHDTEIVVLKPAL